MNNLIMGFIQPCFIRKNTPELRKKLEELGYNRYPLWMADWSDDDSRYIYLVTDVLYYTYPKEPTKPKSGEHINCGTNEELFLALAALRDDTDINQWFVMDCDVYLHIDKGDWFIATDINKGKHIGTQIDPMYCHKATVEEIIEHFKNK